MSRYYIQKLEKMNQNIIKLKNGETPDITAMLVGIKNKEQPQNWEFYRTAYKSSRLLEYACDIYFDDSTGKFKSKTIEKYLGNSASRKEHKLKELPLLVASALLEDVSNGIDVFHPSKNEFKKSKMMEISNMYHHSDFIDFLTDEYLDSIELKPNEQEISWKDEFSTFTKIGMNGAYFPTEFNDYINKLSIPKKAEFELLDLMLKGKISDEEKNNTCRLLSHFNIHQIDKIYTELNNRRESTNNRTIIFSPDDMREY